MRKDAPENSRVSHFHHCRHYHDDREDNCHAVIINIIVMMIINIIATMIITRIIMTIIKIIATNIIMMTMKIIVTISLDLASAKATTTLEEVGGKIWTITPKSVLSS